jgi:hypothetical protein
MKKKLSKRPFNTVGTFILGNFLVVILTILVPPLVYSADRLLVLDTGGEPAFVVTQEGRVGVGTSIPEQDLDIVAPDNGLIRLSNTDTDNTTKGSRMVLRHYSNAQLPVYLFGAASTATSNFVAFGGGNPIGNAATQIDLFTAPNTTTPAGIPRLTIIGNGYVGLGIQNPLYPLEMASGAYVTTGGVWADASSREYKDNIEALTTEEAFGTLKELSPVKFAYKTDRTEKHVGFIAEEVPDLIATKDRKGLSSMDITAVLTKVVQEQQEMIKKQQETIDELSGRLSELEKESRLRSAVANADLAK